MQRDEYNGVKSKMKSSRFLNACRDCRLPRVDGSDFDLVSRFASTWASQDGRQCTLQTARHPSIARHSTCVDGRAVELVSRFASTWTSRSGRPGKKNVAPDIPFFLIAWSFACKGSYSVLFPLAPSRWLVHFAEPFVLGTRTTITETVF